MPVSPVNNEEPDPARRNIHTDVAPGPAVVVEDEIEPATKSVPKVSPENEVTEIEIFREPQIEDLKEQHYTIHYGATGYSYESMIGPYLEGAKSIEIEDPYIRATHQIQNFVRFCEAVIKAATVQKYVLSPAMITIPT